MGLESTRQSSEEVSQRHISQTNWLVSTICVFAGCR